MIKSRTWAALLMSRSSAAGGFCPGAGVRGVKDPPSFPDAADSLLDSRGSEQPSGSRGILLLADGTRFEGQLFGAEEIAEGELVFTTGTVSYTHLTLPTIYSV